MVCCYHALKRGSIQAATGKIGLRLYGPKERSKWLLSSRPPLRAGRTCPPQALGRGADGRSSGSCDAWKGHRYLRERPNCQHSPPCAIRCQRSGQSYLGVVGVSAISLGSRRPGLWTVRRRLIVRVLSSAAFSSTFSAPAVCAQGRQRPCLWELTVTQTETQISVGKLRGEFSNVLRRGRLLGGGGSRLAC